MLDFLKYGTYFMFYSGVLAFVSMLVISKEKVWQFFSSIPIVIYTILSVVYLYLMQDAQLFFWDEYSHWGAFIKEMYYFGHFYDANSVAAHLRYPPGISIWDYFIVLPTGFKESSLYFAYFLILFSSTLMMYEKLQWKQVHWILLIFVMQMVVFATYGHWFSCIYVDHVLGSLFAGMVLAYLVDKYSTSQLFLFVFPIVSITLVKEIGLFFSLSFVGLIILVQLYKEKSNNVSFFNSILNIRKIIFISLLMFVIAFLSLKVWNTHQENLNVQAEGQTISGIIKNLFSDEKVLKESIETEVKKRFWEVVNNQQLHKEKISLNYNEFSYGIMSKYNKDIKLSTTGSILFFIFVSGIIYLLLSGRANKHKLILISSYLTFVTFSYLTILYFSFQVAFGDGALRIPSYVRYMNIGILPLLFIMFFLFLPSYEKDYNKNILKNQNLNTKLIGMVLVLGIFTFITKPYLVPLYSQLENPFRKNIDTVVPNILEYIPNKSKVLVVFPIQNNGSLNNILKYSMIPARATITKVDYFTKKSQNEVLQEYVKFDYIWFTSLNQEIINKSRQILKEKNENQPYTLYKLEKQNNQVQVQPIL
jgi:hypothetical protein